MHMTVWKSHTGHGSMRQYGTAVQLYWVCAHTHILSPLHNFFNHSIFETKLYKVIFQKNFIYNTCISSFSYINLYRSVCQSGMYSFLGVFMTVLLSLLWYYLKCHLIFQACWTSIEVLVIELQCHISIRNIAL